LEIKILVIMKLTRKTTATVAMLRMGRGRRLARREAMKGPANRNRSSKDRDPAAIAAGGFAPEGSRATMVGDVHLG